MRRQETTIEIAYSVQIPAALFDPGLVFEPVFALPSSSGQ
jgi:hypothetical protein